MKTASITADSAADAIAKVRAELGSEAVVLGVRRSRQGGIAGMWQRPRLEVLACLPEARAEEPAALNGLLCQIAALNRGLPPLTDADRGAAADLLKNLSGAGAAGEKAVLKRQVELSNRSSRGDETLISSRTGSLSLVTPTAARVSGDLAATFEATGLLPVYARWLTERIRVQSDETGAGATQDAFDSAWKILAEYWKAPAWRAASGERQRHVLVGPPGVGKTTCLSKWLAQEVLQSSRAARVCRLDGRRANSAESLSIYAEVLGAPVSRQWRDEDDFTADITFIDLPGIDWKDPEALDELRGQLEQLQPAHVHLVLNAACETRLLLDQLRAFWPLPLADVMFTHLDEEQCRGKMLNLVLGTGLAAGFHNFGPGVPGDFGPLTIDAVLHAERMAPEMAGGEKICA